MKMEEKRRAVLAHHGGLQVATDAQINIIWNSLPKEVQERYLAATKVKESKNAPGDKPKKKI